MFTETEEQRNLKIKETEMQMENLDREVDDLLDFLKVSPAQLSAFLSNKENFTDENWTEILKQRQHLTHQLDRDLNNVRNPSKTKKALKSLHVQRHWLHVK